MNSKEIIYNITQISEERKLSFSDQQIKKIVSQCENLDCESCDSSLELAIEEALEEAPKKSEVKKIPPEVDRVKKLWDVELQFCGKTDKIVVEAFSHLDAIKKTEDLLLTDLSHNGQKLFGDLSITIENVTLKENKKLDAINNQIANIEEMQSHGLSLVSCNSCDCVLITKGDGEAETTCFGCLKTVMHQDCCDYWYEGCSEQTDAFNEEIK